MSNIKKGTIVWYWDDKLKDWKRGKITCVNTYRVEVRPRRSNKVLSFKYDEPVIPASENKPDCIPETLRSRLWNVRTYRAKRDENYKLLLRLGFA